MNDAGKKVLASVAPFALITGIMFFLLAVLVAVLGSFACLRSLPEQPERLPYLVVMSVAFSASQFIVVHHSFRAYDQLRNIESSGEIGTTIHALAQFLKAFYFWVALVVAAIVYAMFMPTY